MTEYPARRDPKRPPMHPGALLREDVLPTLGKARRRSPSFWALPARRCTPSCARSSPWRHVDLWQQRRLLSKAIERIPTLHAHAW